MYRGRNENRTDVTAPCGRKQSVRIRKRNKYLVTALLVLVVSLVSGATLAHLKTNSDQVENIFIPGQVSCSVDPSFKVSNTSDVPVYIRAAIVVNWMDDNGNIRAIDPVENTDYTLSIGNGWTKIGDYYYYAHAVAAKAAIAQSVCTVTQEKTLSGFTLVTEVVAEAIQAQGDKDSDGTAAYRDAWGIAFGG